MGGTLPATQNLTNLPTAIESIPTGGGGGDTIYLPNESGATISAGDKVLFTLGTNMSANDDSFTVVYKSDSWFAPICILDNRSFVITGEGNMSGNYYNGYLFTIINNTWTKGPQSTVYSLQGSGSYHYFDNGYINFYNNGSNALSQFMYASGSINVANDSSKKYAGDYNGFSYVITNSSGTEYVQKWNKVDNTFTNIFHINSFNPYWGYHRIFGNRLFTSSSEKYRIYTIENDTTFTLLTSGTIASNCYFLEATGLSAGDIVFAVSDWTHSYSGSSLTNTAFLYCYKIQNNGSLAPYSVPELKIFESTPCYVAYDNRSNILSIGTKNEIYFYEFDTTNKTFTRISVFHTALPIPANDLPLKVQMSPDKSYFVVYARNAVANAVYVYTNQESYQRIVPNSQYYYDLTTSFTGIATGETDEDDNYEISTVLPQIVESKIITDLEPDEVIIKGGAE